MAYILNIETATRTCSAALAKDGKKLALREVTREHFSHAEELDLFIKELFEEAELPYKELDAIGVGSGPGSYTGLRIGVSTAKGSAYALGVPIIPIRTLPLMAKGEAAKGKVPEGGRIVPMLDARRNEVYCSVHDHQGKLLEPEAALDLENDEIPGLEGADKVFFIGSGAEKAEKLLSLPMEAAHHPEVHPSAEDMLPLAETSYRAGELVDPYDFEPFYLKDFVPTTPKNGEGKK